MACRLHPVLDVLLEEGRQEADKEGEIIRDLKFVKRYSEELREVNDGRMGRPYRITYSYTLFLAVFRYVFSVRFRQLEVFTIALRNMFPILPSIDYSWLGGG